MTTRYLNDESSVCCEAEEKSNSKLVSLIMTGEYLPGRNMLDPSFFTFFRMSKMDIRTWYEGMGIEVLEDKSTQLWRVRLPEGWSLKASYYPDSISCDLMDSDHRQRASFNLIDSSPGQIRIIPKSRFSVRICEINPAKTDSNNTITSESLKVCLELLDGNKKLYRTECMDLLKPEQYFEKTFMIDRKEQEKFRFPENFHLMDEYEVMYIAEEVYGIADEDGSFLEKIRPLMWSYKQYYECRCEDIISKLTKQVVHFLEEHYPKYDDLAGQWE